MKTPVLENVNSVLKDALPVLAALYMTVQLAIIRPYLILPTMLQPIRHTIK